MLARVVKFGAIVFIGFVAYDTNSLEVATAGLMFAVMAPSV